MGRFASVIALRAPVPPAALALLLSLLHDFDAYAKLTNLHP